MEEWCVLCDKTGLSKLPPQVRMQDICVEMKADVSSECAGRILVVEDDPMSVQLYDMILTRQGHYQVTAQEDPDAVSALVRSGNIDLVIMDVSLQNSRYKNVPVDGLTLTRILKINPATARVPVLLATAHAMRGDRESFLRESQADAYIAKPIIDTSRFLEQVAGLVQAASPVPE